MAESKFTPESRAIVVHELTTGLNLVEAARAAGLNEHTLKNWLTRGRKDESGDYADFNDAVEEARKTALPEPLTEEEHRRIVSAVARKGSVQALKLYWEMIRADQDQAESQTEPLDAVDELASRRAVGA